jgi:hypothetical protein
MYVYTPVLHWRIPTSGSWDTNTNWTLSLAPAYVHDVVIDPATSIAVTGPAANTAIKALTVGTGVGAAVLQLGSGNLKTVGPLTIAGNSKLDLNTKDLIYSTGDAPSALALVRSYLQTGYAGGSWTGTGITSSAAAATAGSANKTALAYATAGDLHDTTIDGFPVASSDVLVKYAASGDANLDGKVNALDFNVIATNFGTGSGKLWTQGDFNYDGTVSTLDFTQLSANFGSILPSPPLAGTLVPEPSLLSLTGFALLLIGARHRNHGLASVATTSTARGTARRLLWRNSSQSDVSGLPSL